MADANDVQSRLCCLISACYCYCVTTLGNLFARLLIVTGLKMHTRLCGAVTVCIMTSMRGLHCHNWELYSLQREDKLLYSTSVGTELTKSRSLFSVVDNRYYCVLMPYL